MEVSWLLPASKTDTAAIGITRTHGCGCGECTWGRTQDSLENFSGEARSQALCPVRAAARQVLHTLDLARRLGRGPAHFPLFPNLQGRVPSKESVGATIEAAARGRGLPTHHPDGHKRFGGHPLQVSRAPALSRAGFDSWTIGLLARCVSAAISGYIRDAPLGSLTLLARSAISQWGTAVPASPCH